MKTKKAGTKPKKPIMKRWWFWPVIAIFAINAIAGGGKDDKEEESRDVRQSLTDVEDGNEDISLNDNPESIGEASKKSGTYTLPCGMKIQFWDEIRNDSTGTWRRAATSDSLVPADYALEYYHEMFSSDNEIHSIWNSTLKTTTRITASGGLLFVDTLEYVDGEEHDAKIMFSGTLLDSRIIDIETGEPYEDTMDGSTGNEAEGESNAKSGIGTSQSAEASTVPAQPKEDVGPETPSDTGHEEREQGRAPSENPSGNKNGDNFNTYDNNGQQETEASYVLNSGTMKFHYPSCSSAKKIAPENYSTYTGAREEVIAKGYEPCGNCHP